MSVSQATPSIPAILSPSITMQLSILLAAALFRSSALGQLDTKIKAKGNVYCGNILDSNTLVQGQNENILRTDFGAVTAENTMKWDATEPNRGQFNYGNSDRIANWATQNGKLIRGHTLGRRCNRGLFDWVLMSSQFGTRSFPAGSTAPVTRVD